MVINLTIGGVMRHLINCPLPLQEGDKFRLPTLKMLDEDFRCWWWNSFDKCWEYKFRIMIGTPALDENDYIIDKPIGFDKCSQRQIYHKDSALKLIAKGITHFIPYIHNCPPLILCDPLDFDKLTEMRTLEELSHRCPTRHPDAL